MISQLILFLLYILRALTSENCIPSYFIISKNCFINYTIPFYNIPNILKLYIFPILFKYSFLFLYFYHFSFSLHFPLFLPQPLALATTDKTKTVQHTVIPIATTPPPTHSHPHISQHHPLDHQTKTKTPLKKKKK